MSVVSVIACGPSAPQCGADKAPGYRIAVNDAFLHFDHDCVLSMDGIWARERVPVYWAAAGTPLHLRRSAFKYFPNGRQDYPHINCFDCDNHSDEMSPDRHTLNGRHSGQCALNLAFTMRPRCVFLYGFDLGEPTHFFGPYAWHGEGNTNNETKFREWRRGFENSAQYFNMAGIQVWNTNPESRIKAFPHGRPPT